MTLEKRLTQMQMDSTRLQMMVFKAQILHLKVALERTEDEELKRDIKNEIRYNESAYTGAVSSLDMLARGVL